MEAKKMNLIEGSYSPATAQEMLGKLIKSELQFHRLQNFTSLIRYEGNCEQATENIHHLCRAQEELEAIVKKAREENLYVNLRVNMMLSLVDEPVMEQMQAAYPSL